MSFAGDLRTLARGSGFRRLYATRLVSQASDGVFQIALASYVFFTPGKQATAAKAAAAFAVLLLPYSLVGPFAGVLLDRWRRRQVLVLSNVLRAGVVVVLAGLVAARLDGPAFYGVALAALSVNRFFLAALSASLPHVVAYAELVMANSVATTSGSVAAFAGGGVGYALRTVFGASARANALILLCSAGVYLCSSVVATRMGREQLGPDYDARLPETREALRRVARGLVDGARHVWHRRHAAAALAAIAAHRFFYGIWTIATALLYRNYFYPHDHLNAGARGLLLVLVASGAGYFTAAIITPSVTARLRKEAWVAALLVLASVAQLALGMPYAEAPYVAAAFLLGAISQGVKICVDTLVQEHVDDAYRGRVFSFYDMLFNVAFVSAAAFAAFTLPETGKSYAVLGFIAAGYVLTALAYWYESRRTSRGVVERGPVPSDRVGS